MPRTGLPPMRPNAVGLPGLTAMPWKITSPRCRRTSRTRSRSPTELPPEKTRTSAPPPRRRPPSSVLERVGSGAAAGPARRRARRIDRRQREAVDVVDLARTERLARARRSRCRSRASRLAAGRRPRRRRRRSRRARRRGSGSACSPSRRMVCPAAMSAARRPMCCRGYTGVMIRMRSLVGLLGLLDHDDGVGAVGHRRAGRDFHALAAVTRSRGDLAGEDGVDAPQDPGSTRAAPNVSSAITA